MKKIGIMSMQRIANYGSFLQAYGLKKIIEELGGEVQFVDYHPGETLIPTTEGIGIRRKIYKVIETLSYKAPLKEKVKFIKYKKNYATKYYPLLGIGEMNYSPQLDVLVIGSDEVFNCIQNNTNVGFSTELFGENNNADRMITYAASFGNTTLEKLKQYDIANSVTSYLLEFDAISVRDKNSGYIINSLTGKEPIYNLDPVLIYDYIGKCNKIPGNVEEEKYMILYGYSGRFNKTECEEIRKFANQKGLKIFCIGGVQNACDKFIDCDPFKVIAYFQHASYIVTDTFHGTILSVICQKRFISIVRETGYSNSEKLIDLLERLGLTFRMVNDLSKINKVIETSIDYNNVCETIKNERIKSYDYLKAMIFS